LQILSHFGQGQLLGAWISSSELESDTINVAISPRPMKLRSFSSCNLVDLGVGKPGPATRSGDDRTDWLSTTGFPGDADPKLGGERDRVRDQVATVLEGDGNTRVLAVLIARFIERDR
jgi:hypothetical protein